MNRRGMTLIELLAVVGILAMLLLIALPNALKAYRNSKKNNFVTDAQTIYKTAVSQVEVDHTSRNGYVIYCRFNGKPCEGSDKFETLELTGSTAVDYFIVVDREGKVEYFAVTNKEFQYAGGSVYKVSHTLRGQVNGKNNYVPTGITKIVEGMEDFTIITVDNITDISEINADNKIDIGHLAANYEEEILGITTRTVELGAMNQRLFFLDINVVVDGVKYEKPQQIQKYVVSDVYLNGHLVSEGVDDYWQMQVAGTNYRIRYEGKNGYKCNSTVANNERGIITSPTYVDIICSK